MAYKSDAKTFFKSKGVKDKAPKTAREEAFDRKSKGPLRPRRRTKLERIMTV